MKLPFDLILTPLLKPYFTSTRLFCQHPTFAVSVPYTYVYGALGLIINLHHLRAHLGEIPTDRETAWNPTLRRWMFLHDLKITATSMGLLQYSCLVIGCLTENPSLFLPHLTGQVIVVAAKLSDVSGDSTEGVRVKLHALLVALLGISMSVCAFASQPVELELEDDEVAQKLNNVSFVRRITKPTIRLVLGYGKLSAFVTATTSLLLLVAVMSKQSWCRRGARWLAAPALLVAALEAASDASDTMLTALLRGSTEPMRVAMQTAAACVLITVEILVWYFIAKFFEYNPPLPMEERKQEILDKILPQ